MTQTLADHPPSMQETRPMTPALADYRPSVQEAVR